MFGFEYIIAFIKIAFNIAFAIVIAIPFAICWNCIAPKYLYFIPELYHIIPYWHVVAIILVCTYIGEQINKLTPKIISINQSVDQPVNQPTKQ